MTDAHSEQLVLDEVGLRFGGVVALDGVSLSVGTGQIVGLIGPNGAGKSSVVNVATGAFKPTTGRISFLGQDITTIAAHRRFRLGVARTFQNIRIFPAISVLENVVLGADHLRRSRPLGLLLNTPSYRRSVREEQERCRAIMDRVGLGAVSNVEAGSLSLRDQRRVEIARALAGNPKIVILDEPAAGLSEPDVEDLEVIVRALRDDGLGILLIEHDFDFVVRVCDELVALDFGRVIAAGPPQQVRSNQQVARVYLGVE